MNQDEMTAIVKEELKHITSGYGPRHGWLRTYYNRWRRQDLKKGISKEETLIRCIEAIRQEDPSWLAEYDPIFSKFLIILKINFNYDLDHNHLFTNKTGSASFCR